MKAIKRATDVNSVLGIMNLFNEEYYKYAFEVLWIFRSIAMKVVEVDSDKGFYWDAKHPDFWIAEITNELIGRAIIYDYTYTTSHGIPFWYGERCRSENHSFLTYDEASFIAGIANDEKLMDELYRLRELTSCYASDQSNPAYNIYKVSDDLIKALTGHKMLLENTSDKMEELVVY